MRIVLNTSKKELIGVGILWSGLFFSALIVILLIARNAHNVINHLEYVETGRYGRSMVLYAESEKNIKEVFAALNENSDGTTSRSITLASDNAFKALVQSGIDLNAKAEEIDPRPKFGADRYNNYIMMAHLYDYIDNHFLAQVYYAKALATQGAWDKAIDYARIGTEKPSTERKARLLLAELNLNAGRTEESGRILDALFSHPNVVTIAERLIRSKYYIAVGNLNGAEAELESVYNQSRGNPDYAKELASVYQMQSKLDKALSVLESSYESGGKIDPNYMHIYGEMLIESKKIPEAIQVLKQSLKIDPNNADLHLSLAKAYKQNGQEALSSRTYIRAIQLNPELSKL